MATTVNIEVNGKKYKLQHPGVREWLKLKKDFFSVSGNAGGQIDMEVVLDYCFEHVVFPEQGPKLNLDSMNDDSQKIREIEEVWGQVLLRFLRGESIDKTKYKVK